MGVVKIDFGVSSTVSSDVCSEDSSFSSVSCGLASSLLQREKQQFIIPNPNKAATPLRSPRTAPKPAPK